MKLYSLISATIVLLLTASFYKAPADNRWEDNIIIDTLAQNLIVPWEIVFLPDKSIIFTERAGRVRILGKDKPLLTVPDVAADRKMGLLGMCLHPAFTTNHFVYIAYDYMQNNQPLLKVMRYQLKKDTLLDPFLILDHIPSNQNHTGCRLKFGPDQKLYISTGDADNPVAAQSLSQLNGKILRVNGDGTIPEDNPFFNNDTARKEVWTYGHRNTQGLAFYPVSGQLYNSEHGPSGGDEVNIIRKGQNYGWPYAHNEDTLAGTVAPLYEYTPSIGPSGTIFYKGNAFPDFKNNMLVACLRGECIMRIQFKNGKVQSQEKLLLKQFGRLRTVTEGPDGYLYISTSQQDPPEGWPKAGCDMILRIRPKANYKISHGNYALSKTALPKNTADRLYVQMCGSCHGNSMEGTDRGPSLSLANRKHGKTRAEVLKNIRNGILDKGMPSWAGAIPDSSIERITDMIIKKGK